MQGNGFKIGLIVAFLAMVMYYLYPTVAWNLEQKQMSELTADDRELYETENEERLQNLQERSLSLGLDLQGGMRVTLGVGTPQLVLELAGANRDTLLNNVVSEANEKALATGGDFIDEILLAFEARDPNARLSRYFRSDAANISRTSTNADIIRYLKEQRTGALDRAIEIIRTRVDRFGVAEPSIVKQGSDGIVVELPGISDKERVRNLLKGTARLEFRLAADGQEFLRFIQRAYEYYTAESDSLSDDYSNALLDVMIPGESAYIMGYAEAKDTARVRELINNPDVQNLMPRNTTVMWGAKTINLTSTTVGYPLYGVRTQVELTGEVIEEASVQFDPATNVPEVSMTMNAEGARKWGILTGANIGKPIAITLDGYVYTYPNVNTKITGGRSSIEGMANVQEADDLVNILLSGALPAPLEILEERTVGATLGEASIKAGINSIIIGLSFVAIFIIVYYQKAGAVADLALLLNMIFILGILAGFRATLTLPGIAGIVLTIGMAVDANVLIFDRIREEQRAGKTMKAAISAGYSNAMSAIIDSNITTAFVGIVLLSFGIGPIKGFAVTLLAGIACSLFSAIIITRVVIDYLTRNDADKMSFG